MHVLERGSCLMVRLFRLTASVVMVVSGVWLAVTFVSGTQMAAPVAEPAVSSRSNAAEGMPPPSRTISDAAVSLPSTSVAIRQEAEVAQELAPLATVLTETIDSESAAPLPAVPAEMAQPAPVIESAYRSALDLPPPPLLDAQAPPPLVGSSTWRQPAGPAALVSHQPGAPPGNASAAVPQASAYVVRDGDDLTAIATRFYGHPAAARLVYEANRERLPAADILPIGATLILPPLPDQSSRVSRPGGWIEPVR